MKKNDPMRARKAALDAAIAALDERRRKYAVSATGAKYGFDFGKKAQERVDEINEWIKILAGMKEEGPLL